MSPGKSARKAMFIRGLLAFCAALPLTANHALGKVIGWFMALFPTETHKVTRKNIDLCFPDMPPLKRAALTRKSLIEDGKTLTEMGALWLWDNHHTLELIKEVSGEAYLKDAMKQGKGVIMALPHLGAWELVGLYCADLHPMTSLYRPPRIDELDEMIREARERTDATLVPTDRTGVRALYEALKNGELIAILPDQDPGLGNGEFAPFFNINTNTMTLLSRLAFKSGATVLFSYAERLPKGRGYHLHILPGSDEINSCELATSAQAINKGIEECIRLNPAQYQWSYKRFKTRPAGESSFYDENL